MSLPIACSGAMYGGVPTVVPVAVANSPVCDAWVVALAIPKSAILMPPSGVTIRFSGLRSRCTMPRCSAAARPPRSPSRTPPIWAGDKPPHVRPEGALIQVLHGDVGRARVLEEVEHGDDVRVHQRARQARLAHEPAREVGVGRVEGRQLLERHEAVQVELAREVYHRHPAASDLPDDAVAADGPDQLRHGSTLARGRVTWGESLRGTARLRRPRTPSRRTSCCARCGSRTGCASRRSAR